MKTLSRVFICIFAVVFLTACIAAPGCAGTLKLDSEPSGANYTLTLDSGSATYMGSTPDTIKDLPQGTYHLVMKSEGYPDVTYDIPVGGDNSHVSYNGKFVNFVAPTATPYVNPAILNVSTTLDGSQKLGGVSIYVDGQYVGMTSVTTGVLSDIPVSSGSHSVKGVYKDQEVAQTLPFESGDRYTVNLSFKGTTGKLDVSSSPSGANVKLDGVPVGFTPCVVDAAPGEHKLEVSRSGYMTMTHTVTVKDGETIPLNFPLTSEAGTCSVAIHTNPAAAVFFDGEYRGTETLIVTSNVKAGMHKVRVEKEGYVPHYEEINAIPGQNNKLEVTLEEYVPGVSAEELVPLGRTGLTVYCTNAEASVTLDRKSIGKTPLENYVDRDLAAGEHTLKVHAYGYEDYITKITLEPAEITVFTCALVKEGGSEVIVNPTEDVTAIPTVPTVAPTYIQPPVTEPATEIPTPAETPASPAPFLGILAGLAACALVYRRS